MFADFSLPTMQSRSQTPVAFSCVAMFFCFPFALAVLTFSMTAHSAERPEVGAPSYIKSYIKLEPLTVNLQNMTRYLQVTVTLKAGSAQAAESIKNQLPIIRHRIILLLNSQKADNLGRMFIASTSPFRTFILSCRTVSWLISSRVITRIFRSKICRPSFPLQYLIPAQP
jgi:hypothetical protein